MGIKLTGTSDIKRHTLHLLAMLLAVAAAFSLAGCGASTLKDYSQTPAGEAVKSVKSALPNVDVKVVTEYGAPIDPSDEDMLGRFEVVSSEPEAGTDAGKAKDSGVTLVVRMNEETRLERQKIIQAEIDDSLDNGWQGEDYFDDGRLVVFHCYLEETGLSMAERGYVNDHVQSSEDSAEWRSGIARDLKSDAIFCAYTSDGYLVSIGLIQFEGSSKEQHEYSAARAVQIAKAADRYADDRVETYMNEFKDLWVGFGESCTGADYLLDSTGASVYLYTSYLDPVWGENAVDIDGKRSGWQEFANGSTQMVRQNVSLKFYDANDTLWDSFTAERHDWLPADVVELAAANTSKPIGDLSFEKGVHSSDVPEQGEPDADGGDAAGEGEVMDALYVGSWKVDSIVTDPNDPSKAMPAQEAGLDATLDIKADGNLAMSTSAGGESKTANYKARYDEESGLYRVYSEDGSEVAFMQANASSDASVPDMLLYVVKAGDNSAGFLFVKEG